MSRASASRPEFGLMVAGAVTRGIIGRMKNRGSLIGPVAAVSLRVASRTANSLRAGSAVRSVDELDPVRTILCHSPARHATTVLALLSGAAIDWPGKNLLFCDTEIPAGTGDRYRVQGAAVASITSLGMLNMVVVESDAPALPAARRVVAEAGLQGVEIPPGNGARFSAAVILSTAALTPVIERVAGLFRAAGLRDTGAARLAARLISQTAGDYAHSGRQSWPWHVRPPDPEHVAAAVAAAPEAMRPLLSELILAGFSDFGKHSAIADRLRSLINIGVDIRPGGV